MDLATLQPQQHMSYLTPGLTPSLPAPWQKEDHRQPRRPNQLPGCIYKLFIFIIFFFLCLLLFHTCFKKRPGAKKLSKSMAGVRTKAWAAARGLVILIDPIVHPERPKSLQKNPAQGLKEHQFMPQNNLLLLQRTPLMLPVKDANVQPREGETSSPKSPVGNMM